MSSTAWKSATIYGTLTWLCIAIAGMLAHGCASTPLGGPTVAPRQEALSYAAKAAAAIPFLDSEDPAVRERAAAQLSEGIAGIVGAATAGGNPALGEKFTVLLTEWTSSGKWDDAEWLALSDLLTTWALPPPQPAGPGS